MLSLATLFDTVAKRPDWVSATAREGWQEVPNTGIGHGSPLRKYGALAGKLGLAQAQPEPTGNRDIDRLLRAQSRGEKAVGQKIEELFPVASAAADLAGGALPYIGAAKLLRGARAARGLAEVAPGAEGAIAEGAKLGATLEPIRRPEGAKDMAPGQEAQARALQAAVGVATGALLDFGLMSLGEFQGTVAGALKDRAKRVELDREAARAGFDSPEEYLSTLTKVERTPDGLVVRPNLDVAADLPGENRGLVEAGGKPAEPDYPWPVQVGNLRRRGREWSLVEETAKTTETPQPKIEPGAPGGATGSVRPETQAAGEGFAETGVSRSGETAGTWRPRDSGLPDTGSRIQAETPETRGPARTWQTAQAEAGEFGRLATATEHPGVRQMLQRDAELRRAEADALKAGEAPKLDPRERARRGRIVDPETDDLITAIRKLGGIDVATETDWAGRLSHLPRGGFGLPAVEQTTGRGRTLDDLAEALHEHGYLAGRDVGELEARLGLAETGAPVWSLGRQDFEGPAAMRRRASSTDRDWTYEEGHTFTGTSPDYVIDTADGTIVPGRPLADRDWQTLEAEHRDYQQAQGYYTQSELDWLRREGEGGDSGPQSQPGELPESRTSGATERLAGAVEGRAGHQPGNEGSEVAFAPALQKSIADLLNPKLPGDRTAATTEHLHGEERQGQGRRQEGLLTGGAVPEAGRPLSRKPNSEEAKALLRSGAAPFREVPFSRSQWRADFGDDLNVTTPVGQVKIGEGQFDKMMARGRFEHAELVKPTLEQPLFVVRNPRGAMVFIKTFDRAGKSLEFVSVSYDIDGLKVVVSSHPKETNAVLKMIDTGELLYRYDDRTVDPANRLAASSSPQQPTLASGLDSSISQVESPRARYDDKSLDLFAAAQGKTDHPLVVDLTHADRVPEQPHSAAAAGRAGDGRPLPGRAAETPELVRLGQHVAHVPVSELRSGIDTITGPEDAAHVVAGLRKQAQEHLAVVVTDASGKVLRVFQHSIGDRATAPANAGLMAAAALNTPGARKVWMAHNHPSGSLAQSEADRAAAAQMRELLNGSGVEFQGGLVVGPGDLASLELGPDLPVKLFPITPSPRHQGIPLMGRELRGQHPGAAIEAPQDMTGTLRDMPDANGLLLLDSQHRPAGWLPLDAAEMAFLRQGRGGPSARLLAALDDTNAAAFAAKLDLPLDSREVAVLSANLKAFADKAGLTLLDLADRKGNLWTSRFGAPTTSQATFYANPFLPAALDLAKDIGTDVWRYPKRAAARAALGAAAGALASDDETGSGKWWADVAKGAVAAEALAVRVPALGRAIEHLPLMGRGPLDLRQLKRRQQNMRAILDRQTAEVGVFLKQHFTPSARAMMADLIETKGIVPDLNLIHRQAAELDAYLSHAGAQMRRLGMLPEDQELGGYLHRYYDKHLDAVLTLARNKPWRDTLMGTYTLGRGTEDPFGREYFSPGAQDLLRELDEIQTQIPALEKKARTVTAEGEPAKAGDVFGDLERLQARRKEIQKIELAEYVGEESGKPKSFFFLKDEAPRADAGLKPVKAQEFRPKAGEQALGPAVPTAPVADLASTDRVWTLRGVDPEKAVLHRDWTEAERSAWGEIKDAGYRYVRGMSEVSHDFIEVRLLS